MFRKILLSYFPEIKNTEISPIHFHLKLLSSKLFYGISSKYWVENRRSIGLDTSFSYFFPYDKKIKDSEDNNFFYAYKNFASLNWFDNYNIYVIIPSLIILILKTYYKYFNDANLSYYLNPLLYSFNYLFVLFYSRFKQYESNDDSLNLEFMINLLEQIIVNLEKRNKNQEKLTLELMNIIKKEPELLMFVYKITKILQNIHSWKPYTDLVLYDYFVSSSINNLLWNADLKWDLNKKIKHIFLKRYTYYISDDMIILLNMILGDRWYIWYLTNSKNIDFIPYFIDSLSHLDNINFKKDLNEVIDDILDFKVWGSRYISALKNFNIDNIDINIEPNMGSEQVQEIMSKETMDAVKKVSHINEQFLDYYILLVSRKINNNWDDFQSELLNPAYTYKLKKEKTSLYKQKYYWKLRQKYIELDKNYFFQSFAFKTKKLFKSVWLSYDFIDRNLDYELNLASKKAILLDFSKKTHQEYVENTKYVHILRKYFQKDISYFISSNDLKKDYLQKYYPWCLKIYNLTKKQVENFKENVYYPDFIVYYKFLKFTKKKFNEQEFILASRFKETLLWYFILQHIIWYNNYIESVYLSGLNFYDDDIKINIKKFYDNFISKNEEFIEIFSNVNQNKKFSNISLDLLDKTSDKDLFFYDTVKDMTYYNKRMFKI